MAQQRSRIGLWRINGVLIFGLIFFIVVLGVIENATTVQLSLIASAIGAFLFWFRNPHKKYLNGLTFLVPMLFVGEYVWENGADLAGTLLWAGTSMALLVLYFNRYKEKKEKVVTDYFKIPALVLLITNSGCFYDVLNIDPADGIFILHRLTFPLIFLLYIYDRFIFNPGKMKKRFVYILAIQSLAMVVLIAFAVIQKTEAEKARIAAEQLRVILEKERAALIKANEVSQEAVRRAQDREHR